MSTLYNLEPNPTAKVLLSTTAGEIEIELFAKQTPLASRNFLQHCLDGYYDNTIFHRLVPGFIIQGGDPTSTGSGGESAFDDGKPFADEVHSRLKFNRRGLLGMANGGSKNDNGSQFFFTLGVTQELQGKHTMLGRVQGDTIYNLVKMSEAELAEGTERPLYPTKITGAEILINPFDDMVKRVKAATAVSTKVEKKKPKRKAGKAVLSFGGDEDDGDIVPVSKKPKFNPKLVSVGNEEETTQKAPKVPKRKASPPAEPARVAEKLKVPPPPVRSRSSPSPSTSPEPDDDEPEQNARLKKTNDQIEALKASMRRKDPAAAVADSEPKNAIEAMIPATSVKGRRRKVGGAEESAALAMFNAFRSKLDSAPQAEKEDLNMRDGSPDAGETSKGDALATEEEEARLCDLHFIVDCKSCNSWDKVEPQEEEEEADDMAWLSHSLSFAKDRLGKESEWKRKNEEELVVIDPREKEKELKMAAKAKKNAKEGDSKKRR
ncbi:cyclophilin-like protein [Aulographum hederae CBS 113979]|uniref:Cyclophilin-like protein n=1 Tax=Aulographum hederae CBS 113979 TaxID=1176131 RepID=A0A6G1GRL3_9PEZI|nr:cyclophilin-like protein [Aulographum hederae CBS 113979]